MLPAYGRVLLEARMAGLMPAGPVILTDHWDIARVFREADHFALVCAPPSRPFDLSLLSGLDVMLMAAGDDLLGLVERVARAEPERLSVSTRTEVLHVLANTCDALRARGDTRWRSAHRAACALAALDGPG